MNLQRGEGFNFPLFVGGGADIRPRILVGDPRDSQDVDVLETLGGKFSFQLEAKSVFGF